MSIGTSWEVVVVWLTTNIVVAQWLVAIGTLALAAVTVIISICLPRWRKPRFEINFENKEPFCTTANEPPQSYWLRVKVTNAGKSVARSCVGRLMQFKDKDKNIIEREPVRLPWVGTPWRELELLDPIDLNQGDSVFLNVLFTKADSTSKAFLYTNAFVRAVELARARLKVPERPWDQLTELQPTVRKIRIAVYGDNVKPCSKEYSITWDGNEYTNIRLEEK